MPETFLSTLLILTCEVDDDIPIVQIRKLEYRAAK